MGMGRGRWLAWCLSGFMLLAGGSAMGAEGMAADLIARIKASGLEAELHARAELEAAGPDNPGDIGLDERIAIVAPVGQALFAYDGAGGSYHVLADGRILLIDSEGRAGVVARDFGQFIAIATGLPGWRDALRFVGRESLEAARGEWAAFVARWNLEAQMDGPWPYGDDFSTPTPRAGGAAVARALGAAEIADPFGALHKAVNTLNDDVTVTWAGGENYLLFGREMGE